MPICKLCREEKELIKTSHIIPQFMYKELFSEKHRIAKISLANIKERSLMSSSLYDKYILCKKCDNEILGSLESYAAKILYSKNLSGKESIEVEWTKSSDGLTSVFVKNINYTKFKLFLLSLLWRASISKHDFFGQVSLGKYEEIIRKMIIMNDAGDEDNFKMCMSIIGKDETVPKEMVGEPRMLKQNGNISYVFFINGLFIHYNISNHNVLSLFEKGKICINNEMNIAVLEGGFALSYLDSFFKKKLRRRSI